MIQLRIFLLTAWMLLPASGLLGQGKPRDVGLNNTPVVCNDGTIPVSVARAFLSVLGPFYNDQWVMQGWYSVGPGMCSEIGPEEHYDDGGLLWFENANVTLLAFAFRDSTGVWGTARVRDTTDGVFKPSNQKLCVRDEAFRVVRDASKGEDPAARECGRGELAGYYQTPVSLVFYGDSYGATYGDVITGPHSRDYLHVKLGPGDRAIPAGQQSSSQTSSNTGPKPAAQPATATLDAESRARFLNAVREDVTAYIEASKTGFNVYKKGEPQLSQGFRMWESNTKPALAKGCWVVQGTASTFSCLLGTSADLNNIRALYAQLTEDVVVSLPRDWTQDAAPPFGPEFPASKGYRTSSGAHGEIWIARATSGEYELHYQLVTAEVTSRPVVDPQPAAAPDDDPIGPGGTITPPVVHR